MFLSKASGPEQYQIRKLITGKEIAGNVNGSLIVGWTVVAAAKELAKEFVSFHDGVNYEISIYITPVNIPAVDGRYVPGL